ncbi:MAG TPA: DUF1326 domain-containing protein [Gemmatimonadales bacterium]|jgi:hypothetical protein|nr:DUF1326 domain-containing protein [Gemmatimonadales bacterium]
MSATTTPVTRTPYRVKAMSVEACSCAHGCNCQFGGTPNEGICEFVIGFDVKEGQFGQVDLTGLHAVVAAKYPGAIHDGRGHVALFVDERARPEQIQAFATILSGQMGGMPWEALAGTIEKFEGPIARPIELSIEGQRAWIRIAGAVELDTTPLRNPATGEEKEVHITYPKGGFFWNDGNIVSTSTMRVDHPSLRMSWPAKYAATAEVNWTNRS